MPSRLAPTALTRLLRQVGQCQGHPSDLGSLKPADSISLSPILYYWRCPTVVPPLVFSLDVWIGCGVVVPYWWLFRRISLLNASILRFLCSHRPRPPLIWDLGCSC
jgi:hypothetical protein